MKNLLNFKDSEILAAIRMIGVFLTSSIYSACLVFLMFATTFQSVIVLGVLAILIAKPLHDILIT